jgi:O-antigen ligase
MEGAAPAAQLPARGRTLHVPGLGNLGWLLIAVVTAGGAGLLAVANERLAVDVALIAVAAVAIHAYPFPALLAILVVAPKHSPFAELLFMCAAGAIAVWRLPRAPGRAFLWPFLAFLAFSLPGVAWNSGYFPGGTGSVLTIPGAGYAYLDTPTVEGFEWLRLAFVFAVALLAATEVTSLTRFRVVVGATLLAAAYPILTGVKQLVGGELVSKGDFSAVRGSFNFPNEFGVYLVLFLLLGIVALFELRTRWLKVLTGVLVAAALLMLLHSYTRSAWIGFAVALVVIAVVQYRSLVAVALLVLVVAIVGFPSAVRDVQARFGDLASQNAANSKNSLKWRRGQWSAMSHFGSEKPLTGQGFGSYRRKTVEEFGLEGRTYGTVQDTEQNGRITRGFTAHNDLVKSWVETGATGVLLWIAVFAGLMVAQLRAMRIRELKPWATALLGATIALAIISLSDNVQAYTVPLLYLVVLSAALAGASKALRSSSASRASS